MEDILETNFVIDPQPKTKVLQGPWKPQEEPTVKNDEMVIKLPKVGPGQAIRVSIDIIPSIEQANSVQFDDSAINSMVATNLASTYNLGMRTNTPTTFSTSTPMFGGIEMNKTSTIFHLISNAISWGATGVFAALFFSGAVIAPVIAEAGLVGGLITSIGLTVDSALR